MSDAQTTIGGVLIQAPLWDPPPSGVEALLKYWALNPEDPAAPGRAVEGIRSGGGDFWRGALLASSSPESLLRVFLTDSIQKFLARHAGAAASRLTTSWPGLAGEPGGWRFLLEPGGGERGLVAGRLTRGPAGLLAATYDGRVKVSRDASVPAEPLVLSLRLDANGLAAAELNR